MIELASTLGISPYMMAMVTIVLVYIGLFLALDWYHRRSDV